MGNFFFAMRDLSAVVDKGDCVHNKRRVIPVVQWGCEDLVHCPLPLGLSLYAEMSAVEQL